jgi:capsular exopolysaccharide synthesis family protein
MGLFAGMVLGFGLAFIAEVRDTTFDDGEEFQGTFNFPVLAAIPSISLNRHHHHNGNGNGISKVGSAKSGAMTLSLNSLPASEVKIQPKPIVVTLNEPRSIAAEQFGILAMEVRHRLGRDTSQAIAITSATGAEGKTMTALNLTVALAKTMDAKVLLVEADLRKPRLHEYIGFRPDKGLSTLLRKPEEPIESYIWKMDGFSVLPGGPALDDPLRYLTSRHAKNIFARLRQDYQFIVVDTPPIFPIADVKVIADLVDGIVVVVRARQTRREVIEHALENFQASKILGVALNGVNLRQSRYYEAYEYYSDHYLGQEKRKTA